MATPLAGGRRASGQPLAAGARAVAAVADLVSHARSAAGSQGIAALAFLLLRALERKLHDAGLDLSAEEALGALETVCVIETALGKAELSHQQKATASYQVTSVLG